MDTQAYIDSGILEEYFLGVLDEQRSEEVRQFCDQYPVLANALAAIEADFEQRSRANAITPPIHLQEQIWAKLENLNKEKAIDINDLPLINEYTDHKNWLSLIKPLVPSEITEDQTFLVLRDTPKIVQMFVISKTDIDDEVHDDLHESFIILEGECECTVGEDVFRLSAGGYASIPLHLPHSVKVLSPYVMAIMQRVAV